MKIFNTLEDHMYRDVQPFGCDELCDPSRDLYSGELPVQQFNHVLCMQLVIALEVFSSIEDHLQEVLLAAFFQ